MEEQEEKKERSVFVRALHAIFVRDFGYKAFSIVFGVVLWLLAAGL